MSSAATVLAKRLAARIARAEKLAAQLAFSREVLQFYARIARFQDSLVPSFLPLISRCPGALRTRVLELGAVLPNFAELLTLVAKSGPRNLVAAAEQAAHLSSDSWAASLVSYWQIAGRQDQQIGALAQFFSRAFLQPLAELLAAAEPLPPLSASLTECPLCSSRALLGVLRPEGDGAKRFLLCSLCGGEWEFRRILCPTCQEADEPKLPVYVAESLPHIRVEACETCRFYLRTIDLSKDGHAVAMVDDLAALPLTLWAQEHHYFRARPNLLAT